MDVGILILIPILLIGIMVFLYVVPLGLWYLLLQRALMLVSLHS